MLCADLPYQLHAFVCMYVDPGGPVEPLPQTGDSAVEAEALSHVDGASERASSRSAALDTLL